jgi:hypothetical protein
MLYCLLIQLRLYLINLLVKHCLLNYLSKNTQLARLAYTLVQA